MYKELSHTAGPTRAIHMLAPWRKKSCNGWYRFCVLWVMLLATIITLTLMKLDHPSMWEWRSVLLSTSPQVVKEHPPLRNCLCSMKSWPGKNHIATELSLLLPWHNHTTTYQELQEQHPNLHFGLLHGAKNARCSLLPTFFSSIEWSNRHWQQAILGPRSRFSLYSAFFDPETDDKASIRVLGVSTSKAPALAWCHLWFSSKAPPQPVRISDIDYLDYQSRQSTRQMPFLLRCPLPPNTKYVPVAVSLVQKPCEQAANLLKVVSGKKQITPAKATRKVHDNTSSTTKKPIAAVCGPALFYYHEDFSQRLVEWLELLRAQGFGHVFLYVTDVHPNITKVLSHYTQEGFVQLTDYTYPPPYVNEPSLRRLWTRVERKKMFAQENVYFTDCVLRHMHQYRFLAHFDPDEVPFFAWHHNITHFLKELQENTKGRAIPGYRLRMHYFYDNLEPSKLATHLPTYLWVLRHNQRQFLLSSRGNGGEFKPIFDTTVVRGVFSHGSLLCVSGKCHISEMHEVPLEMGYYGHFRHTCNKKCRKDTIHDTTLLRYKEEVGHRVASVLKTLQLL